MGLKPPIAERVKSTLTVTVFTIIYTILVIIVTQTKEMLSYKKSLMNIRAIFIKVKKYKKPFSIESIFS